MINLEASLSLDESEFKPEIENMILKVITSNQEADELEDEGFEFRACPTTWNTDLELYRKRLDQGAIAFCTFIGYELGAIIWVLPSQQVHERIDTYPQKVDYSNGEATSRGSWVNPKYRRMGLFTYNACFNRDPYLVKRGIAVLRVGTSQHNRTGYELAMGIGFRTYAKAHHMKVLWWKSWKEIALDTDQYYP